MRTEMNPGTTVTMTNNPIDVIVKTEPMSAPRRVVPRPQRQNNVATGNTVARAATGTGGVSTTTRRVVPRAATNTGTVATVAPRASNGRTDPNTTVRSAATTVVTTTEAVSNARCLADYTACMENYCLRENTAYNRCYCSSKLTQIDSKYQPAIDALIQQILRLRGGGQWTDAEMNEYWMERVGNYAGHNAWVDLENALNIQWPSPEERMSGQKVFLTGHEYCSSHLRACSYMASSLRDAYVSQISRDCATYEESLQRIKNVAESVVEYYSE